MNRSRQDPKKAAEILRPLGAAGKISRTFVPSRLEVSGLDNQQCGDVMDALLALGARNITRIGMGKVVLGNDDNLEHVVQRMQEDNIPVTGVCCKGNGPAR